MNRGQNQMNYYQNFLNESKLLRVYETKIPRIEQYLRAEIDFVREKLEGTEDIIELGAGYGRILRELAPHCRSVTGIDISKENVEFGRTYLAEHENVAMITADVHQLHLSQKFDIQIGRAHV